MKLHLLDLKYQPMKTFIVTSCTLLLLSCTNKTSLNETALKPVSDFFPINKTKVLVVGTVHFNYPGLDAHKANDEDKIDVLREPKKAEVLELTEYIKKFKPTKIAIEATKKWKATEKLRTYRAGQKKLGRDEREQLGIRIASDLQLDTLYALDAASFAEDLEQRFSSFSDTLWRDYDWKSDDPLDSLYSSLYSFTDKVLKDNSLLDAFKYLNSKENHTYDYGAYLIGDFRLDEHRGADILSIYWYNRNLRIFRKLQDITESHEDRILLIFGNGHAALLRQFLECSPEYEFVEFDSL